MAYVPPGPRARRDKESHRPCAERCIPLGAVLAERLMHATKMRHEIPTGHSGTELFTSGAYVEHFRPEAGTNPFRNDYEAKRTWVIDLVRGQGKRVLDIGGGMGRMAIPLSLRHDVTLCDLSPRMLELARHRAGTRLKLAIADVRALPFADGEFDFALCIDVLPHLAIPGPGVEEIRRVLRPGGTLIIDSTNSLSLWTLAYPRYLGRRPNRSLTIWRAGGVLPEWSSRVHHMRFRQFVDVLTSAGFRVKSRRNFGPRLCPKWHVVEAEAI